MNFDPLLIPEEKSSGIFYMLRVFLSFFFD